jgi:hypothetical protein
MTTACPPKRPPHIFLVNIVLIAIFLCVPPVHAFYFNLTVNERSCYHFYPPTSGLARIEIEHEPKDPHGVLWIYWTTGLPGKRERKNQFAGRLDVGSISTLLKGVTVDRPFEYCLMFSQTSTGDNISAAARPLKVSVGFSVLENGIAVEKELHTRHEEVDADEYMRAQGRTASLLDRVRNEARRLTKSSEEFDQTATTTYLTVICMFVVKVLVLIVVVVSQLLRLRSLLESKRAK